MEQMVNNSYAQQYPNAPQFAHSSPTVFPSPMVHQSMTSSPTTSYRHTPYPNPHQPNFHQTHARSYSTTAFPTNEQSPNTPSIPHHSPDHRRMSTPASLPNLSPLVNTHGVPSENAYQRQTQPATFGAFPPLWQDMGPFTTSLPPESQQMLAPALDPEDPFTANLMQGSESHISSPYYPWGTPHFGKQDQIAGYNPYGGMSATLAPSALEHSGEALSAASSNVPPAKAESTSAPSSGLDFNLSQESKGLLAIPSTGMTRENSVQGPASGQATPHDTFWDSFVQDGWNEESAGG